MGLGEDGRRFGGSGVKCVCAWMFYCKHVFISVILSNLIGEEAFCEC